MASAPHCVDFLTAVGALKHTKRTGWVLRGIKDPECVAAHSFRMGIMAFLALDEPGLDAAECMRIALCHDVAEALVGDIIPGSMDAAQKHLLESKAIDDLCSLLATGAPRACAEIRRSYAAYETRISPEALFVKDCDKIDMTLQALEYEQRFPGLDLSEFFDCTRGKISTRLGKALDGDVRQRRERGLLSAAAGTAATPRLDSSSIAPVHVNKPQSQWQVMIGAFGAGVISSAVVALVLAWRLRHIQ